MHYSDIYGDLSVPKDEKPVIPAATVVLLRDIDNAMEVLMLKKITRIDFGGMWVFPGGRIDPSDYPEDKNLERAARNAAQREAREEAGISPDTDQLIWFAHWTPPASAPARFGTWFFVAAAPIGDNVRIDDSEIKEHQWMSPQRALEKHCTGEVDLAPPTWITLYYLSQHTSTKKVFDYLKSQGPMIYETHVAVRGDGVRVAMWNGDAGYEHWNADAEGERHRLIMKKGAFQFEHTAESTKEGLSKPI